LNVLVRGDSRAGSWGSGSRKPPLLGGGGTSLKTAGSAGRRHNLQAFLTTRASAPSVALRVLVGGSTETRIHGSPRCNSHAGEAGRTGAMAAAQGVGSTTTPPLETRCHGRGKTHVPRGAKRLLASHAHRVVCGVGPDSQPSAAGRPMRLTAAWAGAAPGRTSPPALAAQLRLGAGEIQPARDLGHRAALGAMAPAPCQATQPREHKSTQGGPRHVPPVGSVHQLNGAFSRGQGQGQQAVRGPAKRGGVPIDAGVPLGRPGDGDGGGGGLTGPGLDHQVLGLRPDQPGLGGHRSTDQ
jgi:hypothetical protein